jgi:hypothetical protein
VEDPVTQTITLTKEAWSALAFAARQAVNNLDNTSRFSTSAWDEVEEIATNYEDFHRG